MQLSDKIKKFSVEQAVDDLNKNPVKNLPKLLDWADAFCAGKFEGQRRAIRRRAWIPPTRTTRWCSTCSTTLTPRCSRPRS